MYWLTAPPAYTMSGHVWDKFISFSTNLWYFLLSVVDPSYLPPSLTLESINIGANLNPRRPIPFTRSKTYLRLDIENHLLNQATSITWKYFMWPRSFITCEYYVIYIHYKNIYFMILTVFVEHSMVSVSLAVTGALHIFTEPLKPRSRGLFKTVERFDEFI